MTTFFPSSLAVVSLTAVSLPKELNKHTSSIGRYISQASLIGYKSATWVMGGKVQVYINSKQILNKQVKEHICVIYS